MKLVGKIRGNNYNNTMSILEKMGYVPLKVEHKIGSNWFILNGRSWVVRYNERKEVAEIYKF